MLTIQHQFQFQSSVSSVKGSIFASRARRHGRVVLGHLDHDQVGHGRHLLGLALLVVDENVGDDDQGGADRHLHGLLVVLTATDDADVPDDAQVGHDHHLLRLVLLTAPGGADADDGDDDDQVGPDRHLLGLVLLSLDGSDVDDFNQVGASWSLSSTLVMLTTPPDGADVVQDDVNDNDQVRARHERQWLGLAVLTAPNGADVVQGLLGLVLFTALCRVGPRL